ncbi:MAG: hypothetical protein IKW20_05355 [Bacteroidales bacterium]|nr:hypothetical protein [Bacteroidales bacterium]
MDYELIFWIVAAIGSVIAYALLRVKANREQYVDWIAEMGGKWRDH